MNEMKLLTSVKKLSIALVILIPEDLQCGTRASGQSDSCVVSEIPGKILKTDIRKGQQIRESQSMMFRLQAGGQSVSQCATTVWNSLFVSWVTPPTESF